MTANETTYYYQAMVGLDAPDSPPTTGRIDITGDTETYRTLKSAQGAAREDAEGIANILAECLPMLTLYALRDKLIDECKSYA